MPDLSFLAQTIAVWAVPVLLAITLHEVAHGWAAHALGDDTAARAGRLSLNPLRHVDPVGTLLVPGVMLAFGGFLFGWAKPVPVSAGRLRQPRRDMALVALAGPLSNFLMAVLWGLALKISMQFWATGGIWLVVQLVSTAGVIINLVLMVLNLLPVPPLDGSRVLNGILPESMARTLDRVEPYGLAILLVLLFTGVLGRVLYPPLAHIEALLMGALGLEPQYFN